MLMPMGTHKGKPVANMATPYLLWLVSNDAIRYKRWPLIQEALCALRARFENFDALLTELHLRAQPPKYWKPDRTAVKAEKLRELTARRQEEARVRAAAYRERRRLQLEQELREREEARRALASDGYYAARNKKPAPSSCDDLV